MWYPISQVSVNPVLLALIGLIVGVLGGFFGVGGGFLAAPLMYWIGVPMNFVIGTDLAHLTGKSIIASRRHHTQGHVDLRLGALMLIGTVPGVEAGAQMIEWLKRMGMVDLIVVDFYVSILVIIGGFTILESVRAIQMKRQLGLTSLEVTGFQSLVQRARILRIPPFISLPTSGIQQLSIWTIIMIGLITGFLAGMLGVGGGFLRMPLLVYILGIPTHVAVGTDLFEIMISASFGSLSHAFKGNVDVLVALTMLTGAAIGAQIGATATRYFSGPMIRLLFSFLPLLAAILLLMRVSHWG